MMKSKTLLLIVLTLGFLNVNGQSCTKDKIIGDWIYLGSRIGIHTNIDSMELAIDTTDEQLSSLTFSENDTYQYSNFIFEYKRFIVKSMHKNKPYLFDEKTCEIILNPGKKQARQKSNLEIIYLDDKYLIYKEDNNPKTYYTHVLRRKYCPAGVS